MDMTQGSIRIYGWQIAGGRLAKGVIPAACLVLFEDIRTQVLHAHDC